MTIETARRASLEFACVFGHDGHSYVESFNCKLRDELLTGNDLV